MHYDVKTLPWHNTQPAKVLIGCYFPVHPWVTSPSQSYYFCRTASCIPSRIFYLMQYVLRQRKFLNSKTSQDVTPYCATLYIASHSCSELIVCIILTCNKMKLIYIYIYRCVDKVVEGAIGCTTFRCFSQPALTTAALVLRTGANSKHTILTLEWKNEKTIKEHITHPKINTCRVLHAIKKYWLQCSIF
jgi:hypothetical protein